MPTKGYVVFAEYKSESSDAIYQVRRGGDGVLYCSSRSGKVCPGWLSNKNANARHRVNGPAQCKHTKDYVAKHPGTSYGPQWDLPAKVAIAPKGKSETPKFATKVPNWKSTLVAEAKAAAARGVQTPKEALVALAGELDIGDVEAITFEVMRPTRHELDL